MTHPRLTRLAVSTWAFGMNYSSVLTACLRRLLWMSVCVVFCFGESLFYAEERSTFSTSVCFQLVIFSEISVTLSLFSILLCVLVWFSACVLSAMQQGQWLDIMGRSISPRRGDTYKLHLRVFTRHRQDAIASILLERDHWSCVIWRYLGCLLQLQPWKIWRYPASVWYFSIW